MVMPDRKEWGEGGEGGGDSVLVMRCSDVCNRVVRCMKGMKGCIKRIYKKDEKV